MCEHGFFLLIFKCFAVLPWSFAQPTTLLACFRWGGTKGWRSGTSTSGGGVELLDGESKALGDGEAALGEGAVATLGAWAVTRRHGGAATLGDMASTIVQRGGTASSWGVVGHGGVGLGDGEAGT